MVFNIAVLEKWLGQDLPYSRWEETKKKEYDDPTTNLVVILLQEFTNSTIYIHSLAKNTHC